MTPEQRLEELGLTLPEPRAKAGNYISCVRSGNLLFVSGHIAYDYVGKAGKDFTTEEAYKAAEAATLQAITSIKQELGELSKVKRIVKVLAFVNSTPDFTEQPKVINGTSDILVKVFGPEIGSHGRSALGAHQLPLGTAVEVEMVVEVAE